MCTLRQQVAASPEEVVEQLRVELAEALAGEAPEGGGLFDLVGTLMTVQGLLELWGMAV